MLIPGLPTDQIDPIQLTQDGSKLLVSPSALLVDTASSAVTSCRRQSKVGGAHEAVIRTGAARNWTLTVSVVLAAMRTVKCADCANLSEQLAVLTFDNPPSGAAAIANATIDPTSVVLGDYEDTFTGLEEVTTSDGSGWRAGITAHPAQR